MKKSNQFVSLAIMLSLLPGLLIKMSLYSKFKSQKWEFYSSRIKTPMDKIDQIILNDIKEFHYQYSPDSSFLEFRNEIANIDYEGPIHNRLVLSSPPPDNGARLASSFNGIQLMDIIFGINGYFSFKPSKVMQIQQDFNARRSNKIIFRGPKCPKIIATNSVMHIGSVGPNATFKFDLDFSVCYWENYSKNDIKEIKDHSNIWNIKSLDLKVKNGNYYLEKNLFFDTITINAFNRADLVFDSDNYQHADITVDPTVLVRAPVSIWQKLKLVTR